MSRAEAFETGLNVKRSFSSRVYGWYKRNAAEPICKRTVALRLSQPLISFTFDDYPQSAIRVAGRILMDEGVRGTYYVSLGLLDTIAPAGRLCTTADVVRTAEDGHEVGCHTFMHCHSWDTDAKTYEQSIEQNGEAIGKMIPGRSFRSFSYPIALPRPSVKRVCGRHFASSRGGGQAFNSGRVDLNQLSAFFLEKVNGYRQPVFEIIERNKRANGWLIFATHDVCSQPSQYGCTPEFFIDVVKYAVRSGARILPVGEAVELIQSKAE